MNRRRFLFIAVGAAGALALPERSYAGVGRLVAVNRDVDVLPKAPVSWLPLTHPHTHINNGREFVCWGHHYRGCAVVAHHRRIVVSRLPENGRQGFTVMMVTGDLAHDSVTASVDFLIDEATRIFG